VGSLGDARGIDWDLKTEDEGDPVDAASLGDGLTITGADGGDTERGRGAGDLADLNDRDDSVSEESKRTWVGAIGSYGMKTLDSSITE